ERRSRRLAKIRLSQHGGRVGGQYEGLHGIRVQNGAVRQLHRPVQSAGKIQRQAKHYHGNVGRRERMMRRIVLLTLTILLAGCATTRHEDLARLETRLDALEKRAASQADSALAGPGGPGSPEAVNARGEETLPTLFNRETEDSAWAAATVDRIRRTLTPELPAGGRLLDV